MLGNRKPPFDSLVPVQVVSNELPSLQQFAELGRSVRACLFSVLDDVNQHEGMKGIVLVVRDTVRLERQA